MQRTTVKFLAFVLFICLTNNTNLFSQKKKAPVKKVAAQTKASSNPFGGSSSTPPASANPFGGGAASQPPKSGGAVDPFAPSSSKTSGGAVDPFAPTKSSGGAGQPPANRSAGGNVQVIVVPSTTSNPLSDSARPTLRNESAIISNIKDRNPLAYDDIREDDAIYRHKIWKVIDAREKINAPFVYNEDDGNQLFFSIVFKAVTEDSVLAFEDDKFRKPYKDVNKFKAKFSGGVDTSDVYDIDGQTLLRREVRTKEFPVDSVYEFMVMEDVIFDKEAARLVHRIIGIAPMGPTILPSGKVIEGPHFPYFWIYYPDLRKTLAKKPVYNPKNLGARMTWEDYLENHHFSYYIVKSTMDNVKDQNLKEYIKDPMFRLFEGEKIRDKIFNYEQGLWAY